MPSEKSDGTKLWVIRLYYTVILVHFQVFVCYCFLLGTKMKLTLMFREYCGLCHRMRDGLRAYQAQYAFELEVVDVDADPELEERYNELVPVLLVGEAEICHWYLDEAALLNVLKQA